MKTITKILIVVMLAALVAAVVVLKQNQSKVPVQNAIDPAFPAHAENVPMLLDLGAGKCIPCKAMKPILDDLKANYATQFITEFIDVWQNPNVAKHYGVEMIPTQIFFDAEGKELFRHTGFYSKEDILGKWKELGVDVE
jgi:thioredoxin 1